MKLAEQIDKEIEDLENRIEKLQQLKAKIANMSFPEVVIDMDTNYIYLTSYSLDFYTPKVVVRLEPSAGLSNGISLDEFNTRYVEYTSKTRKLLPKR